MKLVCAQTHLNSHLSLVSRAVASRPSHPILANVLLKADSASQRVILSAFDLSLGIQTSFPAQVETGGVLTLPAKLLNDIVSRLADGDITIESDIDANHITTITSASGRYQVRGMGAEEFPELPKIDEGEQTQLAADRLVDGLRGSLFAASADETKQVLTGVHVSMQQDGLEFAATDGHRLAVVTTVEEDAPEAETHLDVTVPAKALQELMKMLDRQNGNAINVQFDQGQVVFEWTDQRLTSRLLEGQYPNYRQLVPRQFTHQMTIDRRAFLSALERISVLADQKNNIVKVQLDPITEQLTLSVDAQDVGSGREAIPAQISGEGMDIAFNVRYLLDGLKAINSTEVQMQLNTATSPVVLSPLGNLKMTYLVMPVQVRS
ncbi:DNA polymerase III subunit beta [Leptolyngbya sp. NIES-2104]|uniref:DNA polymerase III subunit beta n=1 Tax=Leptolyngbya sp. NIES-2104 TaxID=1552121 RepID=UPI0006ECCD74|nr:DNA polymerase III subunit beta [Leptolyngbya sp. NIES-2104]GAP97404.1 DNA polymerase III beta subunit [Leptolyngbya sp. NIES-2104]